MHLRTSHVALLVLCSSVTAPCLAQSGGGYALVWSSLDCGSPVTSTANGYALRSTIGQPEAGNVAGGSYVMHGGFQFSTQLPTDAPPDVIETGGPLVFRLHGNTPNPFRNRTAIAFSLRREGRVQLRVYDLSGRVVRTVLERDLGAGRHQVDWDGRDDAGLRVAQGIYFLRLRADDLEARRKMVLLH